MARTYRAAVIGCSRMGGFIDNEVVGYAGIMPPYSHGASFVACDRTDLVACSDLREEVMKQFGEAHGVPKEGQYLDFRELIDREQPDIVSVATQPEHRAEIVVYAAEHGVKAIYAEKAFSASMADADAVVETCERNGAVLNLGTQSRWDPGYEVMRELAHGGDIGQLHTLVAHHLGALFNNGNHVLDLMMWLNRDEPAEWVQGTVPALEEMLDGDVLTQDPEGLGMVHFRNGVTAHLQSTPQLHDYEAICAEGAVAGRNNGQTWELRRSETQDHRARGIWTLTDFPEFETASSNLLLVEDLVRSLDTGEPPRGGVRSARANSELIFALMESHLRGGTRVELPLKDSSLRLDRRPVGRQPRYEV